MDTSTLWSAIFLLAFLLLLLHWKSRAGSGGCHGGTACHDGGEDDDDAGGCGCHGAGPSAGAAAGR